MLIQGYSGLSEAEIRKLSYEELIQAVLRMFRVPEIRCEDWIGTGLIPDELADAFRGRI